MPDETTQTATAATTGTTETVATEGAAATETTTSTTTTEAAASPAATTETTTATPPAPVVPETYTLTLPESSTLDPTAIERTAAFARERGLSNDAAQAALELAHREVAAANAALLESYQPGGAAWTQQVETWKQQTLADPALGRTPEERTTRVQEGHRVIQRYAEAHPEDAATFTAFLNDTGLGNHPAAVRLFAWLGEAAREGALVTATVTGDGTKSDAELFYGSPTK